MVTPALENTRLELGFLVGAGEVERAKESNPHDQLGRSVTLNRREQD
jgi:hypothetical protein